MSAEIHGHNNGVPNTFDADLYEVGDCFAFPVQPGAIYVVRSRTEPDEPVVSFTVRRATKEGVDSEDLVMTLPSNQPLTARRRVREIAAPCIICKEYGKHTLDTAYSMYIAGVCGNH
jgi:hypothetical protein